MRLISGNYSYTVPMKIKMLFVRSVVVYFVVVFVIHNLQITFDILLYMCAVWLCLTLTAYAWAIHLLHTFNAMHAFHLH